MRDHPGMVTIPGVVASRLSARRHRHFTLGFQSAKTPDGLGS